MDYPALRGCLLRLYKSISCGHGPAAGRRPAGRIIYFLGHSGKGPDGRLPGTIPSSLPQIDALGFLLAAGGRTPLRA